jgi:hypothetical protein
MINPNYWILILIQIPLYLWGFFNKKTRWFRRQFLKYSLPGYFGTLLIFFFQRGTSDILRETKVIGETRYHLQEKAFLSLSILGILIFLYKSFTKNKYFLEDFYFDKKRFFEFLLFSSVFLVTGFFWTGLGETSFLVLSLLVLLSLIPLELLFQKTSRHRSSRNIIFAIYVLICLLDSHFEGRVKIFLKMFEQ